MKHTYQYINESEMRKAHPWESNHLITIAIYQDGIFTAQTGGNIYQWRASA